MHHTWPPQVFQVVLLNPQLCGSVPAGPAQFGFGDNYDHPESFESSKMAEDVRQLIDGNSIEMPIYDYTIHNRSDDTVLIEPKNVIILEGI